ncbi:MAG: E3 binding domain-containing protein, partial [Desulfobacteraceae bacterium]
MTVEVKVPHVGESVQEAILAQWFKQDGELVAKDEPLFVIETDKVTLEVTAEVAGVLKIVVDVDETVAIGAVVGSIDPAAQDVKPAPAQPTPGAKSAPAPAPHPAVTAAAANATDAPLSPAVRRLVAEKHLDIRKIQGTGPGGRITKGDVLLHLEQAPAGMPEACLPPAELEIEAPPAELR